MKKMFVLLAAVSLSLSVSAQQPYIPTVEGAAMEYTYTNAKGKAEGPVVALAITSVKESKGVTEIVVTTTVEEVSIPTTYTVKGGNFIEAKDASFPAEEMNAQGIYADFDGEDILYPLNIAVGSELPDYTYSAIITFEQAPGQFQMLDVVGEGRKCVAEEEITTPAGTFKCLVVEESETQTQTYNGQSQSATSKTKTWYSEGGGMVKEESYTGRGKLEGRTELTKFTLPE
jgi:hypothetical protein